MSLPDHETPEVFLAGSREDGAALGRLLERYRSYLALLARVQIGRRLRGKVDAADLVQDTFLEAHREFGRFRGTTEREFVGWLRQIMAHLTAHLVRRYLGTRCRDVRLECDLAAELDKSSRDLDRGLLSQDTTPSRRAIRCEEALRLARALEELPPDYREVIILRQLEGLTCAEVAERMGRTMHSVEKLWVRALDRLRRTPGVAP